MAGFGAFAGGLAQGLQYGVNASRDFALKKAHQDYLDKQQEMLSKFREAEELRWREQSATAPIDKLGPQYADLAYPALGEARQYAQNPSEYSKQIPGVPAVENKVMAPVTTQTAPNALPGDWTIPATVKTEYPLSSQGAPQSLRGSDAYNAMLAQLGAKVRERQIQEGQLGFERSYSLKIDPVLARAYQMEAMAEYKANISRGMQADQAERHMVASLMQKLMAPGANTGGLTIEDVQRLAHDAISGISGNTASTGGPGATSQPGGGPGTLPMPSGGALTPPGAAPQPFPGPSSQPSGPPREHEIPRLGKPMNNAQINHIADVEKALSSAESLLDVMTGGNPPQYTTFGSPRLGSALNSMAQKVGIDDPRVTVFRKQLMQDFLASLRAIGGARAVNQFDIKNLIQSWPSSEVAPETLVPLLRSSINVLNKELNSVKNLYSGAGIGLSGIGSTPNLTPNQILGQETMAREGLPNTGGIPIMTPKGLITLPRPGKATPQEIDPIEEFIKSKGGRRVE